jgi:hypothetical protein
MNRVRRGALDGTLLREHLAGGRYQGEMDVANVEHQLVAEMGPDVCLFEDICNRYSSHKKPLDWEDVVRYNFKLFFLIPKILFFHIFVLSGSTRRTPAAERSSTC